MNENISLGHWGKYDFKNYYKKEAIEKKAENNAGSSKKEKKRNKKRQFQNIGLIYSRLYFKNNKDTKQKNRLW